MVEAGPHQSNTLRKNAAELNTKGAHMSVRQKLKEFFADFMKYPYQIGSSLTVSNINYQTLRMAEAMKRLNQVEEIAPPRN